MQLHINTPKKRETKQTKRRKHLTKVILRPILFLSGALLILSAITLVARGISATPLDHKDGVPSH